MFVSHMSSSTGGAVVFGAKVQLAVLVGKLERCGLVIDWPILIQEVKDIAITAPIKTPCWQTNTRTRHHISYKVYNNTRKK